MYEAYWKLAEKPFPQRVRPDNLYRSQSLQNAVLRLRYCIENHAGMALLTGLPGVGKSSLLRTLTGPSPASGCLVHVVFPMLDPEEILHLIAVELVAGLRTDPGITTDLTTEGTLRQIQACLREHNREGRHPVLCLDDAQHLSEASFLSVIQPLTSLCDLHPELQLTILLCGQPVLSSHLRRHPQLSHRVAVSAALNGFSQAETADYVQSSLRNAGATGAVFTDAALTRLFHVTGGNPRSINRLCDLALLIGFADRLPEITGAEIDAVSHELMSAAA